MPHPGYKTAKKSGSSGKPPRMGHDCGPMKGSGAAGGGSAGPPSTHNKMMNGLVKKG